MQSDSDRQAGNVIAFIIVGIVLAALLGLGIYVSKQQGRVASQTDTVSVNTSEKETDDATTQNGQAGQDASDPAPSEGTPTPQSQATTPTAPVNTPQQQVPHTGPSSIASTGPAESAVTALALGLITIGLLSYLRSQRSFRKSALK